MLASERSPIQVNVIREGSTIDEGLNMSKDCAWSSLELVGLLLGVVTAALSGCATQFRTQTGTDYLLGLGGYSSSSKLTVRNSGQIEATAILLLGLHVSYRGQRIEVGAGFGHNEDVRVSRRDDRLQSPQTHAWFCILPSSTGCALGAGFVSIESAAKRSDSDLVSHTDFIGGFLMGVGAPKSVLVLGLNSRREVEVLSQGVAVRLSGNPLDGPSLAADIY